MSIKLGSLFDGSGGFPLAGAISGIEPVWAAEVEPYPIAVTRSRFPQMEHLGSVTEVHGDKVRPVDVITFGSPCQDLSVAGKRAGIHDGQRSNLFFEAIRIIKEMRDATNGRHPTFAVWENVPGAFSSNKGADFRCVLEAFVRISAEISVPGPANGRWNPAGEIVGDGFSIAWRQLDAQYWGVPQRRKRIYLVADFRGGRAGEILFERESLRGNPPQGGEAREDAAAHAEGSAGGGRERLTCEVRCQTPWDHQSKRVFETDGIFPTLPAGSGGGQNDQAVVYDTKPCVCNESGQGYWMQGFGCLRAEGENRPSRPSHVVCFAQNQRDEVRDLGDHSGALAATPGMKQQSYLTYALQGNGIDRADTAGCNGAGWRQDVSYTLNTIDRHSVVYPEVARTLTAEADASPCIDRGQNVVCYDARGNGDGTHCPTLTGDHENRITDYTALCIGHGEPNSITMANQANTLTCMHDQQAVLTSGKPPRKYIIRRLTPLECCRLQGFPDGWGIPDHKDRLSNEELEFWQGVRDTCASIAGKPPKKYSAKSLTRWYNALHTDSAEYKMWGNGIALPCAAFVLGNIAKHSPA